MTSDLMVKWTAVITNIAVVIGLLFVGLEFRNNTRALESERIDSFTQGSSELGRMGVEDAQLSEILMKSYGAPQALSANDLDRIQHWLVINYGNFRRIHRAHQAGLLPDDIYAVERAGVGFAFASDPGREVIEAFNGSSTLRNDVWGVIRESADQARQYCLDPGNRCLVRYDIARYGESYPQAKN